MLTFELLGFAKRAAVEDGSAFPTGGRTRWWLALELARFSGGASITAAVEASPTGDDGTWAQLTDFGGAKVAAGETEKSSTLEPSPDFTVTRRDRFLRGRVTAITGDVIGRVTARGPFLDLVAEDLALLSKELREFEDGLERLVRRAEEDVLGLLLRQVTAAELGAMATGADHDDNPYTPLVVSWLSQGDVEQAAAAPRAVVVDAAMDLPGFGDAMRSEIARQADHRFRRHKLEQRIAEPGVPGLLREMPELVPGLGDVLRPYRSTTSTAWRGR